MARGRRRVSSSSAARKLKTQSRFRRHCCRRKSNAAAPSTSALSRHTKPPDVSNTLIVSRSRCRITQRRIWFVGRNVRVHSWRARIKFLVGLRVADQQKFGKWRALWQGIGIASRLKCAFAWDNGEQIVACSNIVVFAIVTEIQCSTRVVGLVEDFNPSTRVRGPRRPTALQTEPLIHAKTPVDCIRQLITRRTKINSNSPARKTMPCGYECADDQNPSAQFLHCPSFENCR